MEPFHLGDALVVAIAVFALYVAVGGFRGTVRSSILATGYLARLGVVALRRIEFPGLALSGDAASFAAGSASVAAGGNGIYPDGAAARYEALHAFGRRYVDLSVVGLQIVGVVAWLLAGIFLLKIVRLSVPDRSQKWLLAAYALSPFGILWTSSTLREPYQLVATTFAAWVVASHFSRDQASVRRRPIVAAAALLFVGSFFHIALGLASAMLLIGYELLRLPQLRRQGRPSAFRYLLLIGFVVFLGAPLVSRTNELLAARDERIGTATALESASAEYEVNVPSIGPLTPFANIAAGYLMYVAAPLPWQVRSPADLLAVAESALRVTMMAVALRRHRGLGGRATLLVGVAVQMGFSIGTHNFGTALRHNYVSAAVLTALAMSSSARVSSGARSMSVGKVAKWPKNSARALSRPTEA